MLAGRVAAKGPYGWHGRSPDLVSRIFRGAHIRRWTSGVRMTGIGTPKERAVALAAFVRAGLVPPPRETRALTPEEERGKAIFSDARTRCADCHMPASGYTAARRRPRARRCPGSRGLVVSIDASSSVSSSLVSSASSAAAPSANPPARWDGATPVRFARPTSLCTGQRLGSWVRLDCAGDRWVFGFSLLSGSPDGVELRAKPKRGVTAIFPVQPSDRRLFAIHGLSDTSSYAVDVEVAAVITETWIDGEEAPTIVVD